MMEVNKTLLEEFGQDLDGVRLQPGHGGLFKLHADDELIRDKDEYDGDIDLEAITQAIHDHAHFHA